jgi:hypothetical protein
MLELSSRLFDQVELCTALELLHLGVGSRTMKGVLKGKKNDLFECFGTPALRNAVRGRDKLTIEIQEYFCYTFSFYNCSEYRFSSSPSEIKESLEKGGSKRVGQHARFTKEHLKEFEEMQAETKKKGELEPPKKKRCRQ